MADSTPTPSTSFDTAPRLQPMAAPDPASSYAPIAWSAVAALVIAIVFVVVLLGFGIFAFLLREPLIIPWVFALAVGGIAVAFVARRQIAASEGTRIGVPYAAAGWWLCVVGGLVYAAYLGTLEYTVRADAAREFRDWAGLLPAVDPEATDQPELFAAFYRTLPPQERVSINPEAKEASDATRRAAREELRKRYAPLLLKFRQHPAVQQAVRYKDDCRIEVDGLRKWTYQGGKIDCELAVTIRSPEGDIPLIVPMEVVAKATRDWQVKVIDPKVGGAPRVTPYGALISYWTVQSAQQATAALLAGRQQSILWAEVRRNLGQPEFAAGIGPLPLLLPERPAPLPFEAFAANPPVTLPGGTGTPPARELAEFRKDWAEQPQRFAVEPGKILGENLADDPTMPSIVTAADRLVVRMPVQYRPRSTDIAGAGVRMKLVLECTDPAVLGELAAARATAATDRREVLTRETAAYRKALLAPEKWTLLRFESDLQLVRPLQSQQAGPAPPPMGQIGGR